MRSRTVWVALLACMSAQVRAAELADSTQPLPTVAPVMRLTPPKILKSELNWPGPPDREALVFLEFTLSAEGVVSDIKLVEGGFHEQRFVDAAMRDLKSMKFQPALLNGVAMTIRGQRIPIRYKIDAGNGITSSFRKELKEVDRFIRSGDYAGAHFHAQWMVSEKVRLGYEYAVLQAQLAETYALVGDDHRAILAVRNATQRTNPDMAVFELRQPIRPNRASNYLLTKELVTSLLDLRMRLTAKHGMFREALQTYYDYAGLVDLEADDPRVALAEQMTTFMESDRDLIGKIQISEDGRWLHELSRQTFTLQDVKGSVATLLMQCADRDRRLEYSAKVEWTIPASWKLCRVSISAAPGTSLQIVEFGKPRDTARAVEQSPAAP
jgi:hypothetical protein